ncbi:hypothetical protein JDV02_001405 [Purpureocillium takamizusanense]|uniref:Uncharacterized protein n=1 Tax=Purpureocillium takamizusanense TaxID=2060973 RepID=A0A9Q8V7T4_9HYPO|nr:uncharacterized protein JDV02_001405 [Purpureocillium takamizusanense]UNI14811.1 hypothetical protein JDV02_001405 [Purpureocillium takamizusanense]
MPPDRQVSKKHTNAPRAYQARQTSMPSTVSAALRAIAPSLRSRSITTSSILSSPSSKNAQTANTTIDSANRGSSSIPRASVKPKVYNSNIWGSGSDPGSQLTKDQKEEVDEHNRYFAKNQSSGNKEKVDDNFWKEHSKD